MVPCGFDWHFPNTAGAKHLCVCSCPSTHSLGNVCSNPSPGFRIELSVLSCAHCCRSCSSTQNMNLLIDMWSTNVFSHSVVVFLFGQCPLKQKRSLIFIKSTLFLFNTCLLCHYLKHGLIQGHQDPFLCFHLKLLLFSSYN